jgi:uncharacterized protein (TIGR00725 family)
VAVIAVFGSSEPLPGDPLYSAAYETGRLLALDGHSVITGGYAGVMEAASRGAREAGAATIGVTCSVFSARDSNAWLTTEIPTTDLHLRTRELIRRAAGYVVLEGGSGTLAETALLWALHRAGCLDSRPVILLGKVWPALLRQLETDGWLESAQRKITHLARDPDEMARILRETLPREHRP